MHAFVLLLLGEIASASIQFNIASGSCSGTGVFNPCDDSDAGGLCASASDLARQWCCRPGRQSCGSWGQTCTGTGSLAGAGQVFCSSADSSVKWCCNAEYEVCTAFTNAFNLCDTKFTNPYNATSTSDALKAKVAFFATVTSTPSAAVTSQIPSTSHTPVTSQVPVPTSLTSQISNGATVSQTSSAAASNTGKPSSSTDSSSNLTSGAIAGIVIGVVVVIAGIAGCGFYLGRRRSRKGNNDGPLQVGSLQVGSPHQVEQVHGESGWSPNAKMGSGMGTYEVPGAPERGELPADVRMGSVRQTMVELP